jgi:ATP-dependent DNA ligase
VPLPIQIPFAPMDALSVDAIPEGAQWQYEPKWDGFRCLIFRDGTDVQLQSKSGQPLARYFPEIVEAIRALKPKQFVLDGELVIPTNNGFSFDDLLMRLHPAASRVQKLSKEIPARFIAFDFLVDAKGKSILTLPLRERRSALEKFFATNLANDARFQLSETTRDLKKANLWLRGVGTDTDGVIAKQLDAAYESGKRTGAMQKIKLLRTADCVVGGFRYAEKGKIVGSLLLGLYGKDGLLNHVGFCSGIKTSERKALTEKLEKLVGSPGFTGKAPGGLSRWSTKRSMEWQPLKPKLVVEVGFDHVTGERFRHGTQFLRWRPDKSPQQCTMEQLKQKKLRSKTTSAEQ